MGNVIPRAETQRREEMEGTDRSPHLQKAGRRLKNTEVNINAYDTQKKKGRLGSRPLHVHHKFKNKAKN